ncbi:MAG TPA: SDR family oxidoreductase [Acidimicrobiales bacterium]|nr:SDR family oxidoreductase [Acidimicrobiales bacterium]
MDSTKRVALITGANKGIGYEIARQLGQQEITVLVGSRDAERGEEAVACLRDQQLDAHMIVIDVTDSSSVQHAASEIEERFGRLDILVNNAGISKEQARHRPSEYPLEALRETFETNVFAVVTVTKALLPLLLKAPAARIVNQSSSMGSLTLAADPSSPYAGLNLLGYNSSKAALNSVTLEFSKELSDTPVKVNASDPGYCATDLNGHQGYRSPEQGAVAVVRLATLADDGLSGGFFNDEGPVPW